MTQVLLSTYKRTDIGVGDAYSLDTQKIKRKIKFLYGTKKIAAQMADDEGSVNNRLKNWLSKTTNGRARSARPNITLTMR